MESLPNSRDQIVEVFSNLDATTKEALAAMELPLYAALAALELAHDRGGIEYLSAQEIELGLERAGVAYSETRLSKALGRAGNRVVSRKKDGRAYYKLMTRGRNEIDPLLQVGNISVMYIDGERPRTSRRKLNEILSALTGVVRICDPYFGLRSIEALEMIPAECKVRFMTGTVKDRDRLEGPLRDFRKERSDFELKRCAAPNELHDRYVLSTDQLLIVGHGLKDLGSRESFMLTVPKAYASDLLEELAKAFDQRWGSAIPL